MHSIKVSDQTYDRLQGLWRAREDTFDKIISVLIDSHEARLNERGVKVANTNLEAGRAPNGPHTGGGTGEHTG